MITNTFFPCISGGSAREAIVPGFACTMLIVGLLLLLVAILTTVVKGCCIEDTVTVATELDGCVPAVDVAVTLAGT